MKIIDDNGVTRYVRGRLRYAVPPEVGTILGPNDTRELMVVVGTTDDGASLVAYAGTDDLRAAAGCEYARSVTEALAPYGGRRADA